MKKHLFALFLIVSTGIINTSIVFADNPISFKTDLYGNKPITQLINDTTSGNSFIGQIVDKYKKLNAYTFEYSMTAYLKNKKESETGKFYFKAPKFLKIEQTSGKRNGSVAVLNNGDKVMAHPGGLVKFVRVNLDKYDDDLKCLNGYDMVESDFLSLALALKSYIGKGMKSVVTKQLCQVDDLNSKFLILDVYNGNFLYKRVLFDPVNNFPVYWLDYNNNKLYSYSRFYNINTSPSFDSLTFQLK